MIMHFDHVANRRSSQVTAYLARRLVQTVLVLVAVTVLSFALVYMSGDPVRALLPLDSRPEDVQRLRHAFGLDQPVWVQYALFVEHAATGDLGDSLKYRTNALE